MKINITLKTGKELKGITTTAMGGLTELGGVTQENCLHLMEEITSMLSKVSDGSFTTFPLKRTHSTVFVDKSNIDYIEILDAEDYINDILDIGKQNGWE